MYNELIMQRFKEMKNAGIVKNADGKGEVGNIQCGDIMHLFIAVDKNQVITDAKFKTFGCVTAIVSTDIACDLIKGKTIQDALGVTNRDVLAIMGDIPAQKIHCSVMAEEAIKDAVENYRKNQEKLKLKK